VRVIVRKLVQFYYRKNCCSTGGLNDQFMSSSLVARIQNYECLEIIDRATALDHPHVGLFK
jgi:hypothetical protein